MYEHENQIYVVLSLNFSLLQKTSTNLIGKYSYLCLKECKRSLNYIVSQNIF